MSELAERRVASCYIALRDQARTRVEEITIMDDGKDPAVQKRRLRTALREARLAANRTQRDAADALDWSPSKVLRIENGAVSVSTTDLRALLGYYGIKDEARIEELIKTAHLARRQSWAAYRDVLSPGYVSYLGYESAASMMLNFQPLMIPGLLQTEEYARATIRVLSSPDESNQVVDRRVKARLERQKLLTRDDRPTMHFILDEAAIRRRVGRSSGLMIRQLEHLKEVAAREKITIQVLPFSEGEHEAMMGSFVILEFPSARDEDLLYLESAQGDLVVREGVKDTAPYKETFYKLEDLSRPKRSLSDDLDRLIEQMRAGDSSGGL